MHILVTGAARGIGLAIAQACIEAGHRVTACDIDATELESRFQGKSNVAPLSLDVTDPGSWTSVIDTAWRSASIDVLINVAGVLRAGTTGELEATDVALQFNVNTLGVIYGTNACAKRMIERKQGHIINIGSTACLFATPGNAVYAASKHAVRAFSIAAAGDLRPLGIDVSLVGPTAVKTDMLELQRGDPRAALTFEGKRALTPDEVADVVVNSVMQDKPLETYLPGSDYWMGRLCTSFPEVFLKNVEKSRQKGIANFQSDEF